MVYKIVFRHAPTQHHIYTNKKFNLTHAFPQLKIIIHKDKKIFNSNAKSMSELPSGIRSETWIETFDFEKSSNFDRKNIPFNPFRFSSHNLK